MPIDRELVGKFLEDVDAKLLSPIHAGSARLHGYQKLIAKFEAARAAWNAEKVDHIRDITSFVNEMVFSKLILDDPKIREAYYEPYVEGTGKTIGFMVALTKNKSCLFYDVKTVQPTIKDTWGKYENFKKKGWFTPGTKLDIDKELLGGEIAHKHFASRQKLLDYTLEFEEKIRAIPKENRNRFRLVFCGDGVQWRCDHLEDFADFYFSKQCRPDDSLGSMQSHHMKEEKLEFDRSIHGFCYLERKLRDLKPKTFRCKFEVRSFHGKNLGRN